MAEGKARKLIQLKETQPMFVLPFPKLISDIPNSSFNRSQPVLSRPLASSKSCLASPGLSHLPNHIHDRPGPSQWPAMGLLNCSGLVRARQQFWDRRASTHKGSALWNTATDAQLAKNPVWQGRDSTTALSDGLTALVWSLPTLVFLKLSPGTVKPKPTGKRTSAARVYLLL